MIVEKENVSCIEHEEMFSQDKVVFCLMDLVINEEVLSDIPHRSCLDYVLYYQFCFKSTNTEKTDFVMITNEIAEKMGLSEENLFNLAHANTRKLLGYATHQHKSSEMNMIRITNDSGIYGAVNVIYDDVMKEMESLLGDFFYCIPLSVHEMMAVSPDGTSPSKLYGILMKLKESGMCDFHDVLEEQVFEWNNETRSLVPMISKNRTLENKID